MATPFLKFAGAYRFSILSCLCIATLVLTMGFALSWLLTRAVLEYEWESTAAVTRREVEEAGLHTLFTAPRSPDAQERWGQELSRRLISLPEVVRVKVWDREATILWSDEARLIGRRFPDNRELRAALAGKVTAQLKKPTKVEHVYERGKFAALAEVYVPIFSKEDRKVLGVLEIYKVPGRLWATIWWGRIVIWTVSLSGGVVLSLALLPLVKKVYGREVKEESRKKERFAELAGLAQTVTASLDTQRVFDAVVEGSLKLLRVTLTRLWVTEPATGDLVLVAAAVAPSERVSLEGAPTRVPKGHGLVGWVVEHACPQYSPVLAEDALHVSREWARREEFMSLLAIPLLGRSEALGALVVVTRERREFSQEERQLLETFAAQAALAIENARLYEETQQQLKQTETLLAVSQAVGSTLDWTELARRTVREIVRALGADIGGAWVLSPGRDQLLPIAGYHVPKDAVETFRQMSLPVGQPLIDAAIRLEGSLFSSDSQADPRFDHPLFRSIPHKSALLIPLRVKGDIVGGFAIVWAGRPHQLTAEERSLAEAIASQVAVAFENARLMEVECEARERLRLSEARYRELYENVRDIVYVHDLEGRILEINEAGVRASGFTRAELLEMNIARLLSAEDLKRATELINRMMAGERIREFFTAELTRKDGSPLVLECNARLILNDGVPAAIQGVARDVTARWKLEQRQAAFVEIVKELAAEDDFDKLFTLIGERVCRFMGTDSASLCLVEGEELVFRGTYGFDEPLPTTQRRKISESRVGRVVLTQKPHASTDMTTDRHWRDSLIVTQFGYRAILEVPVILRGEVIGVLAALHKSPRGFSAGDTAFLTSLADHMALALDRTNLVRELKARLREAETLLTVSRAVNSTLDLTEILRRVARETARALGADMVGAFLSDPDQNSLRPVAGYRVPKHLLEPFMNFPIPIKGHPALEEAWEHQRPVYSSDAPADPRIDRETIQHFPQRSVLFFPMVVKGAPIGGLFATWWEERHDFTPEELRLVEGMSRQAAIAVENARLYREAREVAEHLRLLGQAVSTIGEVIVVTDLEGRVIFANEAIKAVFGYDPQETLGKASRFLWGPSTPRGQKKAVMDVTRAGGWQGEVHGARADGSEFPVALTTRPIKDESSRPVALVGVVRDLTHEKALQVQLIQAEKLAATGQLAAGVAHEINNPLSVVLGFSSLALENNPPKALADLLETIRAQALRAAKIVRDLLAFARPTPPERYPVDLNEILRQTLALQSYHLANDQIEVVWKLTEPLPKTLADPSQLQQVVLNLVLNAHQAMKTARGRGTLWIETGSDGAQVWAKLSDSGPGISPELLLRIFDPFLTTKPVGQGTGLGLSISYGIVQAHGGQLLAESQPGRGATFTIVLPIVEGEARGVPERRRPVSAPARSLSVLVVDDEPAVARSIASMLEQLGHRAEIAHSGPEALAMLASGSYDLVTLDIRMPHMSGQEVWRALQANTLLRRPRVLFVTGDIVTKEIRTFLSSSGQPYLEKPFELADLAGKISGLI